jgi:hypothetical protein
VIKDLTAAELGRHAENVFLFAGRHQTCARLVYHALILDAREPRALIALSDMLAGDQVHPSGWEQLSAAVLEYALRPESALSPPDRESCERHLFLAKWSWAFARKKDGRTTASWEELQDRSLFTLDEPGYAEFLGGILKRGGSLEGCFKMAHALIGAMAGLLVHATLGGKAPVEEVFHPERFQRAPAYEPWLGGDTAELDALEREREKKSKRS